MRRRPLLTLPLVVAVPLRAWAAPRHAAAGWRHDIAELRFAVSDPAELRRVQFLQRRLGVPLRAACLGTAAMAEALNEGHLEFAIPGALALARAAALMGDRLLVRNGGVLRRALPPALRDDIEAAIGLA